MVWGNTKLSYTPDGLAVSGTNTTGRPWKAVVPAGGVKKCEVWGAKLAPRADGLVIINYGISSSGYDAELTIFFIGPDGFPIPWRAFGRFESNDRGVTQIVDLGGSPGIVVPTRRGDRWDGYAYAENLFSITSVAVSKVVGQMAGFTWPAVSGDAKLLGRYGSRQTSSFAFDLPAMLRAKPGPSVKGIVPVGPAAQGKELADISHIVATPPTEPEAAQIAMSDGSKTLFPLIVVTDSGGEGRTIFFDQYVPDGINELIRGVYTTHLVGEVCDEQCRPLMLWGIAK